MLNIPTTTTAHANKKWNVRHQRHSKHNQKTKALVISRIGASLSMWRAVSLLFIIFISDYYRLIQFTLAEIGSSNFHTGTYFFLIIIIIFINVINDIFKVYMDYLKRLNLFHCYLFDLNII